MTWLQFRRISALFYRKSDFHIVINLSIAIRAFFMHILTYLSVDEILLLRYMNWSTNFRSSPFSEEMAPSWLKHMNCVLVCFHIQTNISCCLLQVMKQWFSLSRYICRLCKWFIHKKKYSLFFLLSCLTIFVFLTDFPELKMPCSQLMIKMIKSRNLAWDKQGL